MANHFCCRSQNAMVCLAHCRQELQVLNKNKTFSSRPRPRPRPRPNAQDQDHFHFLSSRRLETKTLVSRTTSLDDTTTTATTINNNNNNNNNNNENSAQRDANTARAGCSKVRTPPGRPPAVTKPQTGPITIHCAAVS